jgi:hypothetical protein
MDPREDCASVQSEMKPRPVPGRLCTLPSSCIRACIGRGGMFPTRAGACGRALVGASESTGRAAAAPMHGTASGNFAGLLRPPRILDPPGPGVDAAPGPGTFRGTLAQADSLRLRAYARESLTRCSNASRLVLGASDSCGMHMCLSVQSLLLRLSLSRQLQSEPRTARRPGRTRCMALRPQHEHRRRVHLRLDWEP